MNFIDDFNEVDELSVLNINRQRISKDTTINNFGRLFLDFCKQLNLFILNGRIGDDKSVGETTCKNVSVIDYCVANTMFLSIVSNFRVLPFSSILSDVHNPIYVVLNISNINAQQVEYQQHDNDRNTDELPKKWNDDMKLHFVNEINQRLHEINDLCNTLEMTDTSEVESSFVNDIIDKINDIFIDSAKNSFGVK